MQTERTRVRAAAGILLLLSILPYCNTLRAGFTLDDWPNVRENPAVTSGIDLTEIFATPVPLLAYLYRPLTILTFALNEAVAPGNAAGFHLANVLLHAAVTLLVYVLALQLFSGRVALIAAALFAVHPLHTEAVSSIVGRAEVLAALFGLLTLLATGAADTARSLWEKRWWYGCSLLCFSLAVLSKESAVTVLPLVLLYRVTRRADPVIGGMWAEMRSLYWVPYALCFAVFLFFRFLVIGTFAGVPDQRMSPLDNVLGFVPWDVRVRSALGILWDYFGLLNVPLVLSADYSYNQVPLLKSWLSPRCLGGLLVCAAGLLGTLFARPPVRFSVAFPFVTLLLTANLFFPIGTVKAERLLYFPSVGWVLLAALVCDRLLRVPRYRSAGVAVIMVVVVAFSGRTWLRNADWQDDVALFASTAWTAPQSAKAQYNLGTALQVRGMQTQAVEQFERALTIATWTEGAHFGLGIHHQKAGRVDEAVARYREALGVVPSYHDAHTNLCHVLVTNARFQDAAAACRNGLRYHPADANLLKGLGMSFMALGDSDKGVNLLGRALALAPHDDGLRSYMASLGMQMARRDDARGRL